MSRANIGIFVYRFVRILNRFQWNLRMSYMGNYFHFYCRIRSEGLLYDAEYDLLARAKFLVHSTPIVTSCVWFSVCVSVSKITQKRVHGFGWNVACRQMSGHGRTDYSPDAGTGLLSPISYRLRNFAALHRVPASCAATRNFTSGKSHVYVLAGRR